MSASSVAGDAPETRQIKVWGLPIRLFYWSLVACIAVAMATGDELPSIHDAAGYGVLALIGFRVLLGLFGPRRDRFALFVKGLQCTASYAAAILRNREPRYLGHNPLGGWMIVVLLATAFAAAATGWLYISGPFWGYEWIEELHEGLAWSVVVLAGLHVAGVVFSSWRQGENLAAAMVHGRKPQATTRHPEPPVGVADA